MLMDEATGEVKWAVQAHAAEDPNKLGGSSTTKVAMSPNGRFVASVGTADENWKPWQAASGAEWMTGVRHDGTGTCSCQVDDLGRRVLQEGCPVVAHTAGLRAVAFSPCGERFASGCGNGVVILWDAQTGEAERRMQAGPVHSRDPRKRSFFMRQPEGQVRGRRVRPSKIPPTALSPSTL